MEGISPTTSRKHRFNPVGQQRGNGPALKRRGRDEALKRRPHVGALAPNPCPVLSRRGSSQSSTPADLSASPPAVTSSRGGAPSLPSSMPCTSISARRHNSRPRASHLPSRSNPKNRIPRSDPAQLLVRRIRPHPAKEHAHLDSPALQVRGQQDRLLIVGKLAHLDRLAPWPQPQLDLAARPNISHPLGHPARRDQIPLALIRQ